ncbi:MAG: hypothetical protein ACE5JU_12400 [Candidatus Binatia bacterium]
MANKTPAIVLQEVTDPQEVAEVRARRNRFDRNEAWLQASDVVQGGPKEFQHRLIYVEGVSSVDRLGHPKRSPTFQHADPDKVYHEAKTPPNGYPRSDTFSNQGTVVCKARPALVPTYDKAKPVLERESSQFGASLNERGRLGFDYLNAVSAAITV